MATLLVKKTAKELAGAFFENEDTFGENRITRSQRFRDIYGATNKGQDAFIREHWTDFVKLARKILAYQLAQPGTSQIQKDAIYDALQNEVGLYNDIDVLAPSIMRIDQLDKVVMPSKKVN